MIGFLIGKACLIGLVKVVRGPRWHRRHFAFAGGPGCGGGYAYGGHGGDGWGTPYRGRDDFGPRGFDDEEHGRHGGHSHAHGPRPFGGRGFRGFRGPRAILEELELTREQWKALRDVRGEWKDAAYAAKKSAKVVKEDLAQALRTETFDEGLVGASLAKFDEVTDALKKSTLSSLAKAHQVLDAKQRAKLADLVEDGGFRRGPFGL